MQNDNPVAGSLLPNLLEVRAENLLEQKVSSAQAAIDAGCSLVQVDYDSWDFQQLPQLMFQAAQKPISHFVLGNSPFTHVHKNLLPRVQDIHPRGTTP